MVSYLNGDMVAVKGYKPQAQVITFRRWLAVTDKAVALVNGAVESGQQELSQLNTEARHAWQWLAACGLDTAEKVDGYIERRPLFDLPGDPGALVRCRCCGRVLVDNVSKALGYGPECRAGKCKCKKNGG
ncbi:MAG: hypothetical protein FJZ90_05120 [Chloroflexi bacterium]|nr:hypothetical protein [Chloroflexota bacterium]